MTDPLVWMRTVLVSGVSAAGAALACLVLAVGCTSIGGQPAPSAPSTAPATLPTAPLDPPEPELVPASSQPLDQAEGTTPGADGTAAPAVAAEPDVEEVDEQVAEPAGKVEQVLASCDAAQDAWRQGAFDEALAALDRAYGLMLQMPDNGDPVKAQEKADLRHLISRRVVEIYASRQTAVGELDLAIPVVTNEYVEAEIRSFQTGERSFFLDSYRRSGRHRPMISEELRKAGLPEQLSWLPLIESGYKVRALSVARALGLWQFIPSTGYRYGLRRDSVIDERMDPEKATRAAISYLTELHGMFGDWMTAIAAYNCGEQTVLRLINSQKINYLDQFWDLYARMPRETARYVPRFLATLLIVQDPARYGFELPSLDEPLPFERVQVARAVKLAQLERSAGLPVGILDELNPELRHHATPKTPYELKAPIQSGAAITAVVDTVALFTPPVDEVGVHRVRPGDTLGRIAQRYGTTVQRLTQLNRLRNPNQLSVGQKIKVPRRGSGGESAGESTASSPTDAAPAAAAPALPRGPQGESLVKHTVCRGDNLWKLADRYGTTVERIKQDNRLASSRLHVGQVLTIRTGSASDAATTPTAGSYVVQSGDTVASIARASGLDLERLLAANSLSRSSTIYPGQQLVLP